MNRVFHKSTLEKWGLPFEALTPLDGEEADVAVVYQDTHVDSSRWSAIHEVVFQAPDDKKMYLVTYKLGLTEYQDERPWEYQDEVLGVQVEPYETTIIAYRVLLDEDHDHALV